MSSQILSLPWGKETLPVVLPEEWHIQGMLEPSSLPPAPDPVAEIRQSLARPVESPPLNELYNPEMSPHTATRRGGVALVIDDGSRPTPVACLLPEVLAELDRAGLRRADVTLIPALGLHRPMSIEELEIRTGLPGLGGMRCENPECDNPERLVHLGTTSRGTPVWINKTVAEADLVVSIGCIEPHIIASFGGGYKNLVPGVAGRATVAHNHSLNCTPATFNMVGQPIERNPMRLDLEEAAGKLKGRVFIVNAVLNNQLQIVRVVAGDPVAAHREGVRTSAILYGVRVQQPADVIIADSHPMDSDLRQGVKALANSIRATRPGGVAITLVRAEEGVGVFGLANRKLPLGRGALKRLAPLLVKLVPRLKLSGMGEEDRFFLYFALQAMRLGTLLMVAPTIPDSVKANLPFVKFAESPQQAIDLARRRLPGKASTLIFPYGGITYPVFD